jgi:hypothetical protein
MHGSHTMQSVFGRLKQEAALIATGSTYRVEPMNTD